VAGTGTFFLTGANAKLLVNNVALAFATDLTYTITVRHAFPHVLGAYELYDMAPLTYDIVGSFAIIRYVRGANTILAPANTKPKLGNSITTWGNDNITQNGNPKITGTTVTNALGIPLPAGGTSGDGRVYESLNPETFHRATTFDIELRQLFNDSQQYGDNSLLGVGLKLLGIPNNSGNPNIPNAGQAQVVKLRNCRVETSTFSVNKRGAAIQRITFRATYADEDGFTANHSDVGQLTM
jgi:hypothetical protein